MDTMWPKILIELLPHVSRLLPMADKFFTSKAANDAANDAALTAIAENVHGDLGQVTAAQAGLYRQLQELSAQVTGVATDARWARNTTEIFVERVTTIEKKISTLTLWVKFCVVLLAVILVILIVLLIHLR